MIHVEQETSASMYAKKKYNPRNRNGSHKKKLLFKLKQSNKQSDPGTKKEKNKKTNRKTNLGLMETVPSEAENLYTFVEGWLS